MPLWIISLADGSGLPRLAAQRAIDVEAREGGLTWDIQRIIVFEIDPEAMEVARALGQMHAAVEVAGGLSGSPQIAATLSPPPAVHLLVLMGTDLTPIHLCHSPRSSPCLAAVCLPRIQFKQS